jgi:hypothetical protein
MTARKIPDLRVRTSFSELDLVEFPNGARPPGPRCRASSMLLISGGDFGFGRFHAGMVRIRRSRAAGYRVAKPVFYVTGSILTRQAQTFPIRELHATCVARFFWHPIASRREIGRSDERHSRRHSKTRNEFPHALPPSRLAVASVVRGSSATSHVTHITKALDVTDITNGAFHVSRVPGIKAPHS